MDHSPGAREILDNIEDIEARLEQPGRYSSEQCNQLVLARSRLIGQLGELDRAFGGESVADAMRRAAHDDGGRIRGVYDSGDYGDGGHGSISDTMSREDILNYTRQHFGDEAMANVENTLHEQALAAQGGEGEGESDHG